MTVIVTKLHLGLVQRNGRTYNWLRNINEMLRKMVVYRCTAQLGWLPKFAELLYARSTLFNMSVTT